MITKVNNYYLGQDVEQIPNLEEFSLLEYATFANAGAPRMLPHEKIYHAEEIMYGGFNWDVMLGASEGKIYKISLGRIMSEPEDADTTFQTILKQLIAHMGEPSEWIGNNSRVFWKGEQGGNVLLGNVSRMGMYGVDINFTSPISPIQNRSTQKPLSNLGIKKIFYKIKKRLMG